MRMHEIQRDYRAGNLEGHRFGGDDDKKCINCAACWIPLDEAHYIDIRNMYRDIEGYGYRRYLEKYNYATAERLAARSGVEECMVERWKRTPDADKMNRAKKWIKEAYKSEIKTINEKTVWCRLHNVAVPKSLWSWCLSYVPVSENERSVEE